MSETTERARLEAEHVAAGVAKWGDGERAGLEKQARAKSLDTLRLDARVREMEAAGASERDIRDALDDMRRVSDHHVPPEDLGGLVGFGALDD